MDKGERRESGSLVGDSCGELRESFLGLRRGGEESGSRGFLGFCVEIFRYFLVSAAFTSEVCRRGFCWLVGF